MRNFISEYKDVLAMSGKFMRRHWKGVIALNGIITGIILTYYQLRYHLFENPFKTRLKKEDERE